MSRYDNWPDPALRMRNVDEPAIPPRPTSPGRVPPDPTIELARKAVRVRSLTDPLGAMGFRESRPRIAKEGRLRRIAVAGSVLSFAGSFGFVVWSANASTGGADSNNNAGVPTIQAASLPATTPTVVSAANQPSQLVNTDRASLAGIGSLTTATATPNATATANTSKTTAAAATKSTKKSSATKTPTPTATATATATDTPVSSHVRSQSSG